MVHIFTFSDKALIGKTENKSAKFLCENLYKYNFLIEESCIYSSNFNFENISFKNKDIYFLLMQKSNINLNEKLAKLCGKNLICNETLKKVVSEYFSRKNIPIDKFSENEWQLPESAIPITNPNGTTQGFYLKIAASSIFVLPNNYEEFLSIFNDCLLSFLEENFPIEYKSETYKTFGLSETILKQAIKDQIKNKDKVNVSIFSKGLENDIVIKAKNNNEKFDYYRQLIFDKLENYIYAVQPISMDEYLENLIFSNNAKITIIGDASINNIINNLSLHIIKENVIGLFELPNTHSKINFGIDKNQIESFGEESAEIAYDLAVKALEKFDNTDLILSCLVSYSNNSCVVYIAIGNKLKIDIYKNQFFGSEQEIMSNISQSAKFYLIKKLKTKDYKTI